MLSTTFDATAITFRAVWVFPGGKLPDATRPPLHGELRKRTMTVGSATENLGVPTEHELGRNVMTLCPIALAVGCKKCPAFSFCPLKTAIGDYMKEEKKEPQKEEKPVSDESASGK